MSSTGPSVDRGWTVSRLALDYILSQDLPPPAPKPVGKLMSGCSLTRRSRNGARIQE